MNAAGRVPVFVYGRLVKDADFGQIIIGERNPPFKDATLRDYSVVHAKDCFYNLQPNEGKSAKGRVFYVKPEGYRNMESLTSGLFESKNVKVSVDDSEILVATYVMKEDSKPTVRVVRFNKSSEVQGVAV